MTSLRAGAALATLCIALVSCSDSTPPSPPPDRGFVDLPAELQATYDRTCKVCHGVPGTGAPAAGDVEAWAERGAQGIDGLLDHVISGYRGMPPMGMCMECSQDELVAFIEYMSGLECE